MCRMIGYVILSHVKRFLPLLFLTALIFLGIPQAHAQERLKVYYVRHGESGHNVISEWKSTPKAEWPSYVGDADCFTPKGEQQVAALTKKLQDMKFDFIAESPENRSCLSGMEARAIRFSARLQPQKHSILTGFRTRAFGWLKSSPTEASS